MVSTISILTEPPGRPARDEILWPALHSFTFGDGEVHIWAASLDVPEKIPSLTETISADERNRARQFRFEIHCERFITGRGLLREILGAYLKVPPGEVEFTCGNRGKPSLAAKFSGHKLHFNLAHSESLALIAVSRHCDVGIDLEKNRPIEDFGAMAERFFSKRETQILRNLPASQQQAAFFHLWTRKEAWLKAIGEGIGEMLNQVEVSCQPGEPAQLIHIPKEFQTTAGWSLVDLMPARNFVGALAVPLKDPRISCRMLVPPMPVHPVPAARTV